MVSRFVIVGKNGMLGHDLTVTFAKRFGESSVIPLERRELDVCSRTNVFTKIRSLAPCVVLNASAYTNVDLAEKEKTLALEVNHLGVMNLAEACREFNCRFVHFSTDQVFSGQLNRAQTEDDEPRPLNHYAYSKLLGEREALKRSALVLRVQWLYGRKKDRFTPLKDKTIFTPFSDQYGAPAWTEKISETVATLVEKKAEGLFQFSYDDWASWAQVFEFVKEQMNFKVRLEPKTTDSMGLPAARPLFSVMSNKKLCAALGISGMGSWKEPLAEFLSLPLK